jgi:hypothetical protein
MGKHAMIISPAMARPESLAQPETSQAWPAMASHGHVGSNGQKQKRLSVPDAPQSPHGQPWQSMDSHCHGHASPAMVTPAGMARH